MTVDLDNVHKYLLEHPARGTVFPGWTDEQVLDVFEKSLLMGAAYWGVNRETGEVNGCAITYPNYELGYLYVTAFFTSHPAFWGEVMKAMFERFPYYHICGRVGGKIIRFDNAFLRRQFLGSNRN